MTKEDVRQIISLIKRFEKSRIAITNLSCNLGIDKASRAVNLQAKLIDRMDELKELLKEEGWTW